MIWVADTAQASGNFFTVKADAWFDARRVAMMRFGVGPDELILEPVEGRLVPDVVPDVELRWFGSDYVANGGRALLWRAPSRGDEKWKKMESFR